jgi:mRNA interferase HicA
MRGNELIKKVEALGKESGIAVRIDKKRGKGSHQTLYFGDRKTIIRNPKDELKTGTYHAMLKQRGISEGLEMTSMNWARYLRIVWKL